MEFKFLQKDLAYSPKRFFNRELSLLKFHERVLEESLKNTLPLLERLRFLSISGSNLDEFCMVRFASLKEKRVDEENVSIDGLSFKEQIKLCYPYIIQLQKKQYASFSEIKKELSKTNFHILSKDELKKKDISILKKVFIDDILPTIILNKIDNDFPFLENLSINLLFEVEGVNSIISLPKRTKRFVTIANNKNKISLIPVEDLILLFASKVFNSKQTNHLATFSVIRDTLIAFDEKAEDMIAWFEEALKKRKQGKLTLLDIHSSSSKTGIELLKKKLKLDDNDITFSDFLAYRHLGQIIYPFKKKLLFKDYAPRKSERVKKFDNDYFKAIESGDILVHHPYESYEIVVNFLKQAANDDDVISIKQTIYRTNKESPIMYALMDAAKNGKDVTAYIELRARFDEEANLGWAKIMESHGVKVIFGHPKYKFHSKISLIRRKQKNKIKSYVHYGTGNYNPITANIYTDLSFFTDDEDLGNDADNVFDFLETKKELKPFKKLITAPFDLRDELIRLIEKEIEFANTGRPATIMAKANSLMDDVVIDALYKASKAGVKIKLIIRGICSLRPGIKGLSENITVKSIVGRFLEHSRIYCFGNGKKFPSQSAKVYISSADLMRRNMIKRVETLIPIEKTKVKKQILTQIMYANIKDNANSWILDSEMNYNRETVKSGGFCAQEFFMENPSLYGSGRTARLKREVKQLK